VTSYREKRRGGLGTGHVTGSVNIHFYKENGLFLSTATDFVQRNLFTENVAIREPVLP
jgi:hypothetical protein